MHYFYREMDFRETEKPTLVGGIGGIGGVQHSGHGGRSGCVCL